jgi:hypothetical protein
VKAAPKSELTIIQNDIDISTWFSLSYSSYLVLPRILLEAMPKKWQLKFIKLLQELEDTVELPDTYTSKYCVRYREKGKFARDPLSDYRRGKVPLKNV